MPEFSDELIAHVKKSEGWEASPYMDEGDGRTVGYGHLIRKSDKLIFPLTLEQGEDLLIADLRIARRSASQLSPKLSQASERRQDAITDTVFNIGAAQYEHSTLRQKVNDEEWEEAATQMGRWIYDDGKIMPGLVKRRATAAMWLRHG